MLSYEKNMKNKISLYFSISRRFCGHRVEKKKLIILIVTYFIKLLKIFSAFIINILFI